MRRSAVVLTGVVGAGVIAAIAVTASQSSGILVPEAVTPASSCEVQGVVGQEAACEIVVRNGGWGTLALGHPKAPNGIRIDGANSTIGPRGKTTLRAVVDTNVVVGRGTIPVTIPTNDAKRPSLALEVKVEIKSFLAAVPGYARYIFVQKAREGTIVQTIAATDATPFHVLGVESPAPYIRVAWREAKESERRPEIPGSQWLVESTISSDAPVGAITGDLIVRTDHAKQPILRVPVSGFVRPVFAVTPPTASLSVVDPATAAEVRLHVKNFAEEAIAVTGASTTVPGISASVTPVEAGRVYYVVLKFTPDLPAGPFKGTVQIRTASPKTPVVEVPIDGTGFSRR
jgi:hypothetical protein